MEGGDIVRGDVPPPGLGWATGPKRSCAVSEWESFPEAVPQRARCLIEALGTPALVTPDERLTHVEALHHQRA